MFSFVIYHIFEIYFNFYLPEHYVGFLYFKFGSIFCLSKTMIYSFSLPGKDFELFCLPELQDMKLCNQSLNIVLNI